MPATTSAPSSRTLRLALWSSVPIAVAGLVASLAGLFTDGPYAAEAANWASQGAGQDAVNLVIYPALVALAWLASRGSIRAYLGWLGLLAYSAYSYLVYAGFVHFSGWFLLYVALLGMSTYALIVGLALLDPGQLRRSFSESTPTGAVGAALLVPASAFVLLWLSEIVPPALSGETPEALVEAGLVTNPVWMLDLAIVLPAMIAAGWLLRRRRATGFLLAGPLLGFGFAMGAAILGMQVMLAADGFGFAAAPVVMMSIVMAVQAGALIGFLRGVPSEITLPDVVRLPPQQVAEDTAALADLATR